MTTHSKENYRKDTNKNHKSLSLTHLELNIVIVDIWRRGSGYGVVGDVQSGEISRCKVGNVIIIGGKVGCASIHFYVWLEGIGNL